MMENGAMVRYSYVGAMNPVWVAVSCVVTLLCWGMMKKHAHKHIASISFTIPYLCLVYTSTVLSRSPNAVLSYQLVPFWSYARWFQGETIFLQYIILNILLLAPIGFSLSFVWRKGWRILCLGFAFSCLIEVSQLVTGRGLFETDDIIHNTVGVLLGILLHTAMERVNYEYFSNRRQGHGGNGPGEQPEKHS